MALTDVPSFEPTGVTRAARDFRRRVEQLRGALQTVADEGLGGCREFGTSAMATALAPDAATMATLYGQIRTMLVLLGSANPGPLP